MSRPLRLAGCRPTLTELVGEAQLVGAEAEGVDERIAPVVADLPRRRPRMGARPRKGGATAPTLSDRPRVCVRAHVRRCAASSAARARTGSGAPSKPTAFFWSTAGAAGALLLLLFAAMF